MKLFADSAITAESCWPAEHRPRPASVAAAGWLGPLAGLPAGTNLLCWERPSSSARWKRGLITDRTAASQYDLLRQTELPEGGFACLALCGDNFHGQHGRPWQALRGNLHLCLKADLDLPAARCGRALVMLPAVAVMDVLDQAGVPAGRAGIKWVNDILVGGRKVAGVLTSARAVEGRLLSTVFGIGLNVAAVPAATAALPAAEPACLAQVLEGPPPSLGRLFDHLLARVDELLDLLSAEGPEPLLDRYRARSLVLGRMVGIWPESGPGPSIGAQPLCRGRVLEILPDLSLRLEGVSEPVTAGRLGLLPDPPSA